MTATLPYTISEAVQFRLKDQERWRDGSVSSVTQRRTFVEVVVEYKDRGVKRRLMLDAASPDLRKWREGKIEKDRKPKKKRQRVRYPRAMPRVD